jgi:hypothetical protein
MNAPIIPRKTLTETDILTAIADDISAIKSEDRLSWKDIGRVVDRHHDQVPRYADGSAKMDIVSYSLARKEWGGRFTGRLDRLIEGSRLDAECDRGRQSKVLRAALALSIALEDDDEITAKEVEANRATIENARDALDALLSKPGVRR